MKKLLITTALTLISVSALAHGPAAHAPAASPAAVKHEQQLWGIAGEQSQGAKAIRTVDLRMGDDMRFRPDHLDVALGETVRLRIKNEGAVMHELVIGTPAALIDHAAMMVRFPNMAHEEPWMAHVPPGQLGEIVWRFNRAGDFAFACLIAGHYSAGMRGTIRVSGVSGATKSTAHSAPAQAAATSTHAASNSAPEFAQDSAPESAWTRGEIRRIDLASGKVTLKHEHIAVLDMPPMSMVFLAKPTRLLDGFKLGDAVRFVADVQSGQFVITALKPATESTKP
jgi:uncharacterized cupredoxin-like copper-binding protein/Cu/Ag efflux protein CusF